ncbi:HAD-IIA family hydrolase [Epidermidibacterium keratini]|uniref:HAD-IIA family hydrolase n=1 Tax=Epidermidibacterium keratini TaxID=1891644 RepID=A0A7L4YJ94_9ACTN|nr:HAD-IIA family hydrolase [Epidermidibacterium keratini]QHB98943.1 HAD-IIA family hydrolase [Epidermidibacterium keratini]
MDDVALCRAYDVGLFDLDGVIYRGDEPVPYASEAVAAAREAGMQIAFVTNNASRTPQQVASQIQAVGVAADASEVITSAQVAADVLGARLPAQSRVLVVGADGLREAVSERGLVVVDSAGDEPAAVVQGHSPDTGWRQLAEAVAAIRGGALWVASNRDSTLPTERGLMPGNGAFVNVVAGVLGREPDVVAGKPDRTMHEASVQRTGARKPLVIGDRLDTDIEGATNAGTASLLVLTGVSTPPELYAAPPALRPTYLSADLRGLLEPGRSFAEAGERRAVTGWRADEAGVITAAPTTGGEVGGDGGDRGDTEDAELLRLACALRWNDEQVRAGDQAARDAMGLLGLPVG